MELCPNEAVFELCHESKLNSNSKPTLDLLLSEIGRGTQVKKAFAKDKDISIPPVVVPQTFTFG